VRDRVKIIVNPVSGKGKALRLAEGVAATLKTQGCNVDLLQTKQGGDAKRMAAESAGYAAIAATGGDGTVNEVLNGLPLNGAAAPPALAMLPSGTANVLAKELKLPRDAEGLARMLREGKEAPWDLGVDQIGGRRFLLFASAGYDAHVVHLFHAARTGPIQMWQYLYWGLKSILHYDAPRISVELDGVKIADNAAWVLVSQVACYGGPLVFTPGAQPGRGSFEVMVQRGRGRWNLVRIFRTALFAWMFGWKCRLEDVSFHPARKISMKSGDERPVPVQVDGDPGGHLPIELEIVPGGITVVGP
jgi:YegS/Rv2252/BmrU family lipid kinase